MTTHEICVENIPPQKLHFAPQTRARHRPKFLPPALVAAAFGLATLSQAQTSVFFAGGNASQTVLYDRATNILNGTSPSLSVVISPTNSTVRTYTGSIAGQSGLGTVTVNFSLLGAVQGLQDVGQNSEVVAAGGRRSRRWPCPARTRRGGNRSHALLASPHAGGPLRVYQEARLSPNLANVTNLTQRQAAYLEGAAGTLPSAFFGGAGRTMRFTWCLAILRPRCARNWTPTFTLPERSPRGPPTESTPRRFPIQRAGKAAAATSRMF